MSGTTKAEVLIRARNLLSKRLEGTFDGPIHIIVNDEIPANLRNNGLLTLKITGGNFDFGAQAGGGANTVHYQGSLRVSIWSANRTDRAGVAEELLTASGRGLLRLETRILKALLGSYLQEVDAGGDGYTPILTQAIHALSDSESQQTTESGQPTGTMAIDFGVDFKWDLDSDTDEEPE